MGNSINGIAADRKLWIILGVGVVGVSKCKIGKLNTKIHGKK